MSRFLPDAGASKGIADAISRLGACARPAVAAVGEVIQVGAPNRPSAWRGARRAVVLPGSFNPLHEAHLQLLAAAVDDCPGGGLDVPVAVLSLSVRTVDKDRPTGMRLEDRAWTMHATMVVGEARPSGVALIASHGLYVDQATALREAMPQLALDGLWFAIGHDKAEQIFDPKYYADRDSSLDELFTRAGLLVAPRAGQTGDDLRALLERPSNRRYAGRVRPVTVPARIADVSSTAVRTGATRLDDLPAPVAAMVRARRCYD